MYICNLAVIDVPESPSNNTSNQSNKQIEKGQEALPSHSINS